MKEEEKKDLALFRYGIIAPLVTERDRFRSDSAFFRHASLQEYTYRGTKVMVSEATTRKLLLQVHEGRH